MAHARILHSVDFRPEPTLTQCTAPLHPYDVNVEDRWNPDTALALWNGASTASVFNHPAWWDAAIESFGQGRRIFGVTARHRGKLCGYWPFWEKRLGAKDAFVRVLEPVGSRLTDYVMPLVAHEHDRAPMIAAMLEALKGELGPRTMILWSKADRIGAADIAIGRSYPAGRYLVHRQVSRCPRMALAPSYGELQTRWSATHRTQLRRRLRRLEKHGEVSLFTAGSPEQIRARLPVLFDMHRANWRARGAGSEFDDQANVAFIERLVENLPAELLHYTEVRAGDTPVASHLGFVRDGDILWYKPSFDIAFSRCSPGMVHVALVARSAIENGFAALDFMQGEESYKFTWADCIRETVSHAIARPDAFPVWFWNTKLRKLIVEFKA